MMPKSRQQIFKTPTYKNLKCFLISFHSNVFNFYAEKYASFNTQKVSQMVRIYACIGYFIQNNYGNKIHCVSAIKWRPVISLY